MTVINKDNAIEVKVHEFVAEASELRWKPGYFPLEIKTTLGNSLPFQRYALNEFYASYRQLAGCIVLRVYND